jgi:hypothetical protein
MQLPRKDVWQIGALLIFAAFLSLWYLRDALRGIGPEYLFFAVPALIGVVGAIFSLARLRRPEAIAPAPAQADPVAATQRLRRLRMVAMTMPALMTVPFIIFFAVRSGTVWLPILVGGITLVVSWTIVGIAFRRVQRQEPPIH